MIELKHDPTMTKRPSYSYPTGGDPLVKCTGGHIGSFSRPDHTIAPDGTVTPSLVCPDEQCEWHENIRLLDWPPPRPVKPERPGSGLPV